MRRILAALVCLSILLFPLPAKAEEVKYVALTFDDGPSGRFTQALLDGLEERGVKATFLLCGYRLKIYPKLAQRIFDAGHEIGLHGYTHDDMGKMTPSQIQKEITDTLSLLPKGCKPVFLRPPGGSFGAALTETAKSAGLSVLLWSVDPRDWASADADTVEAAVLEQIRNADVVLMHDMKSTSVDAALRIVDSLKEQGFRFVTASELARLQGISLRPGKAYRHFR